MTRLLQCRRLLGLVVPVNVLWLRQRSKREGEVVLTSPQQHSWWSEEDAGMCVLLKPMMISFVLSFKKALWVVMSCTTVRRENTVFFVSNDELSNCLWVLLLCLSDTVAPVGPWCPQTNFLEGSVLCFWAHMDLHIIDSIFYLSANMFYINRLSFVITDAREGFLILAIVSTVQQIWGSLACFCSLTHDSGEFEIQLNSFST